MVALDTPKIFQRKKRHANVPHHLVYEILDGKHYYYKGFLDVMANNRTPDEIVGSSLYQWKIIEYLLEILFNMASRSKYSIATNEPGLHLDRHNKLSGAVLLLNKKYLPQGAAISVKYAAVPAVLHIEVDIAADLEDEAAIIYLEEKINKLLAFGTVKIIWIFTQSQRVLIATSANNWQWYDWSETLPLIDGATFSIADYLKAERL